MKTPFLPRLFAHRLRRLAALVCCLASLLASGRLAQAQFNQAAGTNGYNFFGYDGNTGIMYGTDPATPLSGSALPAFTFLPTPIPAGGINAINALGTAVANVGNAIPSPFGVGSTLTLTDTGPAPDEVRLDWCATYVNAGAAFAPLGFGVNVSGTDTGFSALAGGVTIFDSNNGVIYTATLGVPPSTPGIPFYGPLGPGPWYVNGVPGAYNNNYTALVPAGGPTIATGDTIQVQGFLELVVDPGTMQVTIEQVPEPSALALSLLGGLAMILTFRTRWLSQRSGAVS